MFETTLTGQNHNSKTGFNHDARVVSSSHGQAFQGGQGLFRMFTWGFTPGFYMAGFQPSEQRGSLPSWTCCKAEVDALKRLQAETATELDALLPAILDRAFKGEL